MNKLFILFALFLSACDKEPAINIPDAKPLTRDATGYYCLMTVVNHAGPKGQIILDSSKVLWFTSVRDTIAFTRSPEEPKNISVIYVNDMANVEWNNPGLNNWINAKKAWYVIGSNKKGGMGEQEIIPFSTKAEAKHFVDKNSGAIHNWDSIPENIP